MGGLATIINAIGVVYTRHTLMKIRRAERAKVEDITSLDRALAVERELNNRLTLRVSTLEARIDVLETLLNQKQPQKNVKRASNSTSRRKPEA